MPPSVTDTRAPPPSAAFAKAPATATATASAAMVERAPSDLRGATATTPLVPEVRPDGDLTSASENGQASAEGDSNRLTDSLWHEDLLGDDDAWAELAGLSAGASEPAVAVAPSSLTNGSASKLSESSLVTDCHEITIQGTHVTDPASNATSAPAPASAPTPTLAMPPPLLTLRRRRRALVWFRQDLRLHDNLALQGALTARLNSTGADELEIIPAYIIHKPEKKECGAVRFQFLLECLHDLQHALRRKGSDLLVLRGEALDVLRMALLAWGVTDLFYEEFVMPYATKRDDEVNRIAQAAGAQVHTFGGRTLFDPKAILSKNNGRVCTDFSKFVKIVQELPQPPMPVPAPASVPPMETTTSELCETMASFCMHYRAPLSWDALTGTKAAAEPFSVPELAEFDHTVPATHSFLYGGETVALQVLDEYCSNEERVGLFEKPRTSPACTDKQSTTTLSPYITFGCLSLREFFYRIMFIQLKFPGRQGPPPVTLDGQLMWREFFYCFGVGVRSFDTQDDNPMCMQINWKLAEMPTTDSSQWTDEIKTAMDQLRAWREGRTGYPWIDAVLRQIEQDGWAHHVARHAVACFLTRGDLYISWLRGAYFFQEKLIDMDWPINIGNWLWVSSSCFFHDYHQIHSPSMYVQAWDPQGNFIRKWVPALKNMPARYIFEPWKAPLSVQRTAGCLIGKDYPFPIVDHSSAMKKCVQWLDGAHAKAHQHDGVLAPCCDHEGKRPCHFVQKQRAALEAQQQQAEAKAAPPKKRQRHA